MSSINQLRLSLKPYDSYPIHNLLDNAAKKFPDKTAIIDGDNVFSYREIREASLKFGSALFSFQCSN